MSSRLMSNRNRFLTHATFTLLMAMPLTAEIGFKEGKPPFKEADVLPFLKPGHHNRHCHKHRRKRCCKKGPTGPTGPTGATGAQGSAGGTGVSFRLDYASFFTQASGTPLSTGTLIAFESASVNDQNSVSPPQNNTTITPGVTPIDGNTVFVIQVPGDYLISLGLNFLAPNTTTVPTINILKNGGPAPVAGGIIISPFSSPVSLETILSTRLILAGLNVGDMISIQNGANDVSLTNSGSSNAQTGYLTFQRLGPFP